MPTDSLRIAILRIYPPLRACIKFSTVTFGLVLLVLIVFSAVIDLSRGDRPLAWILDDLPVVAAAIAALLIALGLFLFAIGWTFASSIQPHALKGSNIWGWRNTIAWKDIGQIVSTHVEGMPVLVVGSVSSGKEIYIYTLGADAAEIHESLRRYAGADHPLTGWFRPN